MRLSRSSPVTLAKVTDHTLTFHAPEGRRFHITVLDEDLVRVRHYVDGGPRLDRTWMVSGDGGDVPREGRHRDDLTPFLLPAWQHARDGDLVTLQTARLRVTVELADFRLQWATHQGTVFAADAAYNAYPYDREGRSVEHLMWRRDAEHYYGFGERSGPLDKRGRRMEMRSLDALGYDAETTDPLYKHFPFYITFLPDEGIAYGLLYDNLATTVFDMGQEIDAYRGPYRRYRAEDGDIDYYLIYGPGIPAVVRRLAQLTGRMALPPRWSLGYLGSTMTYTEAADAQVQLARFVELCREHDIPCDLFHLSSGYTTGEQDGKRYVFNWNRRKIPDPAALVQDFHRAGIRLSANIKPYLLTTHPLYAQARERGVFIRAADAEEPETAMLWSGGAYASAPGAYVDFTGEAGYTWWQERVQAALLDYGIYSTWNDNNEYEIWDDAARCDGWGQPLRLGMIRPVQALLMARASYEAQRRSRPDERPFVISRSGMPGIQRYAQTWSGDNATSWHTLRYNIPMGLGLSLSGAPNLGHDAGGFFGPRPDPELFVRWVQNAALHPRFTIHSYNTDGTVNEPWMFPEMLPFVRAAIRLRYRLIPYLYTLFFQAAEVGDPIIRPMVYAYPHDARCHTESFDWLLGPALLVASVLEPGARTRQVYLPSGTGWYDFHLGLRFVGGQEAVLDAPLERGPMLAVAGSLIPMGRVMRYIGEQPDDLRQVKVFPGDEASRFTLIEDDGVSMGYTRGEWTAVNLHCVPSVDKLELEIDLEGDYPLPYDRLEFLLPPGEERPVRSSRRISIDMRRADGWRSVVIVPEG